MEITLKAANSGLLSITQYKVRYPFSVHMHWRNEKTISRTTNAVNCENIQGSFRLYYARKINLTKHADSIGSNDRETNVVGGKLSSSGKNALLSIPGDDTATQYLLLPHQFFMYISEKNVESYLNDKKTHLPLWLIGKEDDIKESVQFILKYENETLQLKDEIISLFFNLEYDDN